MRSSPATIQSSSTRGAERGGSNSAASCPSGCRAKTPVRPRGEQAIISVTMSCSTDAEFHPLKPRLSRQGRQFATASRNVSTVRAPIFAEAKKLANSKGRNVRILPGPPTMARLKSPRAIFSRSRLGL